MARHFKPGNLKIMHLRQEGGKRMTGPTSPEFYFLKTSGFGETL